MRYSVALLISLGAFNFSCQTKGAGSDATEQLVYDGKVEEQDSLPDCNTDMSGSLFWVSTLKIGFECQSDGQWKQKSLQDPDQGKFFDL